MFQKQPYQDCVRDFLRRTLAVEMDELLVYRKRLRREFDDYQRNVPPHLRAACLAGGHRQQLGLPLQYRSGSRSRISDVMTTWGRSALEIQRTPIGHQHYIERQLQPVAGAILPFVQDDLTKLIDSNPELF